MANHAVVAYVNDHLAGSAAALQLLDRMVEAAERPDDQLLFESLRADVTEDRHVLEAVLHRLGGRESSLRQAGGWLAEKALQLKFMFDDPGERALALLESLELLALGILGKRGLWRAFAAAGPGVGQLQEFDFVHLEARADEQHQHVEARRLEAARDALR